MSKQILFSTRFLFDLGREKKEIDEFEEFRVDEEEAATKDLKKTWIKVYFERLPKGPGYAIRVVKAMSKLYETTHMGECNEEEARRFLTAALYKSK